MKFADPVYFLLLIPVVIFFFLYIAGKIGRGAVLRFSSVELVKNSKGRKLSFGRFFSGLLRTLVLAMLVCALARPQTGTGEDKTKQQVVDIIIALDVSGSMATLDFQPDNRLIADILAGDGGPSAAVAAVGAGEKLEARLIGRGGGLGAVEAARGAARGALVLVGKLGLEAGHGSRHRVKLYKIPPWSDFNSPRAPCRRRANHGGRVTVVSASRRRAGGCSATPGNVGARAERSRRRAEPARAARRP